MEEVQVELKASHCTPFLHALRPHPAAHFYTWPRRSSHIRYSTLFPNQTNPVSSTWYSDSLAILPLCLFIFYIIGIARDVGQSSMIWFLKFSDFQLYNMSMAGHQRS